MKTANHILSALVAVFTLVGLSPSASAAPAIQSASGTITHKGTVTITGSGFGNKATAAPLVWDDASTGSVPSDNGKWTDAWPSRTDSNNSYVRYTTPIRNIPLPHNHITRYIAGAHGSNGWTLQVALFKEYAVTSYPFPVFISYYYRMDDAWNFCAGDNNFKFGTHAAAGGPMAEPVWYYEHRNPDLTATQPHPGVYTPYIPDNSSSTTHSYMSTNATTPHGNWVKIEYEASYTNQSNGYAKIWSNGVQGTTYNGPTDAQSAAGKRTDGVGGYARCYGYDTNWRYFADVYFDTTYSRVELGNGPTYASSTMREMQIPSAWSANSITATVNLGQFTEGQTAYLYVFDSSGVPNSTGYPVTLGGSGSSLLPPAPSDLQLK
jgi:hypothetical protein